MEQSSSDTNSDSRTNSGTSSPLTETNHNITNSSTTRYSSLISTFRFLRAPLSTLLSDYSPILLPPAPNNSHLQSRPDNFSTSSSTPTTDNGEVSIRIIAGQEQNRLLDDQDNNRELGQIGTTGGIGGEVGEINSSGDDGDNNVTGSSTGGNGDSSSSSYQHRYDLQQAARLIEQIIPFSLLLLVVFIRQHLQGFFVTIYVTAFMFKSNDILRKQTALKGERKMSVLVGYFIVFMLHVIGVYWWYRNDDLFYPLFMVPPKAIPPFWHAIFTIVVNDTMVRQAAMAFKLALLMYYKNGRGHNFRRQGQMLTLVEYALLLYRALLPTPIWYRFFLNKDYGSLFSSVITGLYLTFKLTSVVEKVRSFFSALKALSRKEVHYGSYATPEQVNEAGDLCAICQEKMHVPVLLCCKHIFCEDCASEWFERERTCPLCRALVRPADLRSYGDGSTSLFVQFF